MPSYTNLQLLDDRSIVLRELRAAPPSQDTLCGPTVDRLRAIVPFDGFAFSGLDIEGCQVGRGVYLATNFPNEYTDLYSRERFFEIDPMARLIREDSPIVLWDAVNPDDLKAPEARKLCRVMKRYAIGPRTSVTLWNKGRPYGAAMFTRRRAFTDDELKLLDIFSPVLHSALSKPLIEAVNDRLGLTQGERLCLKLAGAGLTAEEVAADSPYTFETVNTYLKSAARKLKASNRTHAVAEAIRRKIIS